MKKYEVTIDILDETYINNLIVALVRQGYAVYFNSDEKVVCFTATDNDITEIKI